MAHIAAHLTAELIRYGDNVAVRCSLNTPPPPPPAPSPLPSCCRYHFCEPDVTRLSVNHKEEKGEPKAGNRTCVLPAYQPSALPPGQAGSRCVVYVVVYLA